LRITYRLLCKHQTELVLGVVADQNSSAVWVLCVSDTRVLLGVHFKLIITIGSYN